MKAQAAVLLLAVAGAALAWQIHPIFTLGPLACPGLPAALMLQATIRHGSAYYVTFRYPPEDSGSVTPHE